MNIYRDCASGGAEFDGPGASITEASISIFRGNGLFETVYWDDVDVTDIEPDLDNPCLIIPPGVCVEQGVYVFTRTLPISDQTYTITYQRCCRNNSINNIIMPGTSGATYTVQIIPEAQTSCNNSPVFNEFPPIIICQGQPLSFDHSATDAEGDQLIYSFCAPFLGGGVGGSTPGSAPGAEFLLNGVAPDPDAPPPYNPVTYIVPTYSSNQPMAGNPVVSINPNTGLITGTPDILGQFVVGVCVEERRNGEVLSIVRRDFQFNVASCDPTVFADIQSDEIIDDQAFLINICGNAEFTFINESIQQQYIDEFYWQFEIDGDTSTYTTWDATVAFPDTGLYMGQLVLNPGTDCGDTATIFVNVFPEIHSDFDYAYDTCVAGPVTFIDESFTGSGEMTDWLWNFGDGTTSTEANPVHLYDAPGTKNVSLLVTDINGCQELFGQQIDWLPAPAEIIVEPSTFLGCAPADVFFNNLSSPIDDSYDIIWTFGDGTTSGEISPTHTYDQPGTYSVTLDITSPIGCYIGIEYPNWITVRESPEAGFDYNPKKITNLMPEADFTDESLRAIEWEWYFGADGFSREQNPSYVFPDTGFYEVTQVVFHENGCTDTAQIVLDVEPIVLYYLPNAFTPNNDTKNDLFLGNGIYDGMRDFEMTIWNRWGELLFQTNDPYEGWNGQKNNNGPLSQTGVYIVYVHYLNPRGESVDLKGYATLVK